MLRAMFTSLVCTLTVDMKITELLGRTNVGKSSVIGALIEAGGIPKKMKRGSGYKIIVPTVSVFPHTTLGNVEIPLSTFRRQQNLPTQSSLFDTPGIEGDNAFLNSFIDPEYSRAVSLLKLGGFQHVPMNMTAGLLLL
jgi:ribosome biogenesis GTPase A